MPRITLWGFYQYDKTLFDGVILPQGLEKETLINEIVKSSGDLYTYHQQPDMLKHNITFWFSRRFFDFDRMYHAMRAEYSPIENYDRTEDIKREQKDSGTDTETLSLGSSTKEVTTLGSSTEESTTLGTIRTTQRSGSDSTEKQVSAFNDSDYTNREKDVQSYNSTFKDSGSGTDKRTTTGSGSDTRTSTGSGSDTTTTDYGKTHTESESVRVHGNIGVTTSQHMIEEEITLRVKFDVYRIIAMEFEREFIVQIY